MVTPFWNSGPFYSNSYQNLLSLSRFIPYLEEMRKGEYLGNFELMVLLALMRLGEDAYGVTIGATWLSCSRAGWQWFICC